MAGLAGKTIIFLGSSVTYGARSGGVSFVEGLENCAGIVPVKEAVSRTTLVDNGDDSYIARMKRLDVHTPADAFICQLSTNDATLNYPLGEITTGFEADSFDTSTVTGAMEYIIAYARKTWNCPVIFYTNVRYASEVYAALVERLFALQKKWDIGVIDLWNDAEMNAVGEADYQRYMADKIHPTLAGYIEWITPKFEAFLRDYLR